jgi:Flp pilus assembly protein TadD
LRYRVGVVDLARSIHGVDPLMRCCLHLLMLLPGLLFAAPPSAERVLHVPDTLVQLFQQQVLAHARQPDDRLQHLVQFMFDPAGMGLEYDDSITRTIEQGFVDRKGNCLSFTLTFIELARLAGLDAEMQESEHALVAMRGDSDLVYVGHVNASVRINRRVKEVHFDPNRPLLRGSHGVISTDRALAHYYNNRGAELMAAGDSAAAEAHYAQALQLDASMVSAHNNRGVMYLRMQDPANAERAFLQALDHDSNRILVLSNLVSLYRSTGRQSRLAEFELRLAQAEEGNPYHHFIQGMQLERQGAYSEALQHYKAASRLDPGQPLYQWGLNRSFAALGDERQARRHEKRALALDRRPTTGGRSINMIRSSRQ